MPVPLRDLSGGRLKAWPGGGVYYPDGRYEPTFRPAEPGEKVSATVIRAKARRVYCKYCYRNCLPLTLREEDPGAGDAVYEMTICSECGSGLTPPCDVKVKKED